jgi:hypothetical protein
MICSRVVPSKLSRNCRWCGADDQQVGPQGFGAGVITAVARPWRIRRWHCSRRLLVRSPAVGDVGGFLDPRQHRRWKVSSITCSRLTLASCSRASCAAAAHGDIGFEAEVMGDQDVLGHDRLLRLAHYSAVCP